MKMGNITSRIEMLKESPVRKFIKTVNGVTIFENEKHILNQIEKNIDACNENLKNRLKIVVLGEVKAGKSTLVNALIGKKVSYTNVVEATANILEIKYSEEDKGIIHYNDNSIYEIESLEILDKIIKDNIDNQEYFKKINRIVIETKTERLKEILLVDTPGLNTITIENADRTENYIANSDVILWILSANHLGQADVEEKIEEVLEYGKPIIAVINRKDEVHEEEENLINYVDENLGYMFERIFATSGKIAWEGQIEKNEEKIESSNINKLYEYLLNNIERNAELVQKNSIRNSIEVQINKDIYEHKNIVKKLEELIYKIDKDIKEIEKFNNDIKSIVYNKIDLWIEQEFFENERLTLINANKNEFKNLFENYTSGKYIEKLINEECERLNQYLFNEWKSNTDNIINKQSDKYLNVNKNIRLNNQDLDGIGTEGNVVVGAKQGGAVGAAAALGMASYAAWLGPAAAYVSIGTAVSAFVPPLLIAGLLGGIAYKVFGSDKDNKNKINIIESATNDIKRQVRINVVNNLRKILDEASDKYKNQSINTILSILDQCNISYDKIKEINNEIKLYISKIRLYENEVKSINIDKNSKEEFYEVKKICEV